VDKQADTEQGVGSWLVPLSWSGGLCAGEGTEEEEVEGSPPSSSSVTSDSEG